MPRMKLRLKYITGESSRRNTFLKRNKGLVKKVSEINTLCDIKVAAVIYNPLHAEPEVFPSHPEVHQLLKRFQDMPEMDKTRHMLDHEAFLKQQIEKIQEQIRKISGKNREKDITHTMFNCLKDRNLSDLETGDLKNLTILIEQKIREVEIKQQEKYEQNRENQLYQVEAVPVVGEFYLTRRNTFGEGTSRGIEQQQQTQIMEEIQHDMRQIAAPRQQQQQLQNNIDSWT